MSEDPITPCQTCSDAQKTDEECVRRFLLDIGCLDLLSKWTRRFNLFDVLGISRVEIRHSNALAWLMDPNENHGLGDGIIRGFIRHTVSFLSDMEAFDDLLMDCHDLIVLREWQNIDISAVSESQKYVLCIENKIGTGEHDDQLSRHLETVRRTYPDFRHRFIYLSPDGSEASDPNTWIPMSYEDVLEIIGSTTDGAELSEGPRMLIEDYADTIRRNVLEDEDLARICRDIYAKHRRALDLIYENLPETTSELADACVRWARERQKAGELVLNENKCVKTSTRFTTPEMSLLLPDGLEANSGWSTTNHYFFEIKRRTKANRPVDIWIEFTISHQGLPANQEVIADAINQIYPAKETSRKEASWEWRMFWNDGSHKSFEEGFTDDEVFTFLDSSLKKLKVFERDLFSKLPEEYAARVVSATF